MAVIAPVSGTKNQESKFLNFVLSKVLSDHGKRVMFVTSLYGRIVRLDSLRTEAIEKLNDVMQLATNHHALELPTLATNFIWRGVNIHSVLNAETLRDNIPEAEAMALSEQAVDLAPMWLQYPREKMVEDVMCLIRQGHELSVAAA